MQAINTDKAPSALGTYSQAMRSGELLFVSGQLGLDPETGQLVEGGVAEQAKRAFRNIVEIAATAGASMQQCVKVSISMTDLAEFASVNEVMAEFFPQPYPARACIGVAALPAGAAIEIETIFSFAGG